MKHHFGDFLDRTGDYWTIVPNRDRYAYSADVEINDKEAVRILTISKHHQNWEQVFNCPNLEELTLHDPSKEEVQALRELTQIKRLRVTFFVQPTLNLLVTCKTWKNSYLNMYQAFLI